MDLEGGKKAVDMEGGKKAVDMEGGKKAVDMEAVQCLQYYMAHQECL